jgi:exonuclease VII small subunit
VGAVAAVLQLSDTGLNGIGKLKDAYKHYHRRSTLLDRCQDELQSIKSLVELVKTESALHTAAVARALNRLKGPEEQLEKWLTKVSTGNKSAGHNFLRELTHGSDDRKQLKSIMKELDQANHHLDSVIQIRHVEMSRKSAERDVANRKGKREGGPKPRERLGKAEGANRATPGRGHSESIDVRL